MRGYSQEHNVVGEDGGGPLLTMSIDMRGTSATCVVRGEVDIATASQLANELGDLVDLGATTIVLDIGEVAFLGSEGVSIMRRVRRRLGDESALVVRGATPIVQRMLDVCGMAGLAEAAPLSGAGIRT